MTDAPWATIGELVDDSRVRYADLEAWLYRVRGEFRAFNYMGDTTWISAAVTNVRVCESLGALVDIEVTGLNQRGQKNINGWATFLVPSRVHGPVVLPEPSPLPPELAVAHQERTT